MTGLHPNNSREFSILVVDDIESIRYSIKDFLSREFRTFAAADGFEAIRICKNQPIDLVITDIRMPGMGGLQLIKILSEQYPAMKFALMTAYSVDDYIEFVRNQKVWNIIPKSTSMDLNFVRVMAHKLLTNDIFGIQQYFPRAALEDLKISD
ncbi:MAG: response regulator, partial [Leptospirales bacterium]